MTIATAITVPDAVSQAASKVNGYKILEHVNNEMLCFEGSHRTTCPICGPDRKKYWEKTLSVKVDGKSVVYMCHHCEESGMVLIEDDDYKKYAAVDVASGEMSSKPVESPVPPPSSLPLPDTCQKKKTDLSGSGPIRDANSLLDSLPEYDPLGDSEKAWFLDRGISPETLIRSGVTSSMVYVRTRGEKVRCVGFPYINSDGSVAVKWRDGMKNFTQTGSARSLWGIERFSSGDIIITEGEMDALSFREIGVFAVSVPNGAPSAPSKRSHEGRKYSYLWDAKDILAAANRIIIAGDQDEPGAILPEEIARRIGKARCWRMQYPSDCKDPNDVLVKHGKDKLKECLNMATPWPIGGLRDASEYRDDAIAIWKDGFSRGVDISIGDLSKYYRPSPQTLTICTGVPGSGKSTFLTWLSMYLARNEGWNIAVFSAETSSQVHLLQLASLYTGKPFMGTGKMSESELRTAIEWISNKFVFIDESDTSISSVVERAQAAVMRNGVRGLIIDPFNFLTIDHAGDNDNGQHGISTLLVSLKTFAVEHDVAVWLVAHPTKMYRDSSGKTPIPTGYDISGSAHFFNVADSGITLSRDKSRANVAKLTSWKSRFTWLGSVGSMDLSFNPGDGSFKALSEWGRIPEDWEIDQWT